MKSATSLLHISINGTAHACPANTDIVALLEERGMAARQGIAVARNGSVVPTALWSSTRVQDGDEILIITATQGG